MPELYFDKEKIGQRIEDIQKAKEELKKFQEMSLENFLADRNNFYLSSYWLRIALEAILTIGTHILSRLPQNGKKKDYTQVILSLGDYNVLPKDFILRIKGMAGYRNRLVHLYWEVKPEELWNVLQENLADFDGFVGHIKEFLQDK